MVQSITFCSISISHQILMNCFYDFLPSCHKSTLQDESQQDISVFLSPLFWYPIFSLKHCMCDGLLWWYIAHASAGMALEPKLMGLAVTLLAPSAQPEINSTFMALHKFYHMQSRLLRRYISDPGDISEYLQDDQYLSSEFQNKV